MKGQWYLNPLANPEVEVLLPRGLFSGHAETVSDTAEKLQAMRLILKGSGPNSSMYDFDPAAATDEVVCEKTKDIPVVRITLDRNAAGEKKSSVTAQVGQTICMTAALLKAAISSVVGAQSEALPIYRS